MKVIILCTHARESFKNILHILHSYTSYLYKPTFVLQLAF